MSLSPARKCASTSSAPSRASGAQHIGEFPRVVAQAARRGRRAAGCGSTPRPFRAAHPETPSTARPRSPSAREARRRDRSAARSHSLAARRSRARSCRSRSCRSQRQALRDSSASMSASERNRQASGVAPVSLSRATRCSLEAAARRREAPCRFAPAPPANRRRRQDRREGARTAQRSSTALRS